VFSLRCVFAVINDIAVFKQGSSDLARFFDEHYRRVGDTPIVYVNTEHWTANMISSCNYLIMVNVFKKIMRLRNNIMLDISCGTGSTSHFLIADNIV